MKEQVKFFDQSDNLKKFVSDLRKNPPFTAEEETLAFKSLRNGNKSMRDQIFLRNQRYVYSLAKVYARDESEVMDYVNEGNIGLAEAIDKFDVERGLKFITCAVWYIRRAMNGYLHNDRDIIQKTNANKIGKKVDIIKNKYFAEFGYYPSYDEIKDILKEKYNIVIINDSDLDDLVISSINNEIDDDYTVEESSVFNDKTSCDNAYEESIEKEYAKELVVPILGVLPEENREFIKKLYNIGYTGYTEEMVMAEYNLDEVGLRHIENNVLKYMRQCIEEKQIDAERSAI